jgi:hypothetical protein
MRQRAKPSGGCCAQRRANWCTMSMKSGGSAALLAAPPTAPLPSPRGAFDLFCFGGGSLCFVRNAACMRCAVKSKRYDEQCIACRILPSSALTLPASPPPGALPPAGSRCPPVVEPAEEAAEPTLALRAVIVKYVRGSESICEQDSHKM